MENIYQTGYYASQIPDFHESESGWKAGKISAFLKAHQVSFSTVCEVGCGSGGILAGLQQDFPDADYIGYDISPDALALAEKKRNDRLKFVLGEPWPVTTPQYDLGLFIDVLEHVPDYLGFLEKTKTLARIKLFHIPLDLSVQSLLRIAPILRSRSMVGHLHYFCMETALATLADVHLRTRAYAFTSICVDAPTTPSARLARVFRLLLSRFSENLCARILGGYSLLVLAE